jgi:hypothetical protein
MAQQTINIGSVANDGTGDPLRTAFDKVNDNFTELYADDAGDVNSVNAGTGISVNQTTGAVTVTNSAPDQTVSLADGGNIGISGTYPSFTLTNSAPNANHTGDVTGATALTIADDVISYAKLAAEFTTSAALSTNVDFSTAQVFTKTLSGATTLTFSNTAIGMVKDLVITGNHALTLPSGSTVAGTYNGAVSNLIQVVVTGAAEYWFSISQAQ